VNRILVLRPEPGAGETADRARRLGLDPVVAPLFRIRPMPWSMPEGRFDALLLTSANAARMAGTLPPLPCYAVGEATAAAATAAGAAKVITGPADGAAALQAAAADGRTHILHLCGRDHVAIARPEITIERRIVYAADAVDGLPAPAAEAIGEGALVLLHSPRAAACFAHLAGERAGTRIAAISAATAAAAGKGWSAVHVAALPRDQALLELAAQLCKAGSTHQTELDR
jgi:uroporphyrinogen-III synthase